MFPNSPYAHPVSSFERPVPLVLVDPDTNPLVCVSFNSSYLPYIIGALKQLLLQSTWDTNDPSQIDLQQMRVFDLIYLFSLAKPCTISTANAGIGGDFMPLIRQNPSNGCILEGSFDNITWVTIFDASKCSNFGTSPGSGTSQPPAGGGTAKNCYTLNANGILNLGTPVNSGDIITLDVSGSGWDGTETDFGPLWRCPDGSQFIAGLCTSFQTTSGSDPVPSAPHMSTVISINGTFYSILPGSPFTVPAGISSVTPFIQVNDTSLADNQGSYNVCVTIQNNMPSTFTHTFDFVSSNGGFIANPYLLISGSVGNWVGGSGWLYGDAVLSAPTNDYRLVRIYKTFPSTTITSIQAIFNSTAGGTDRPTSNFCEFIATDQHETGIIKSVDFAHQPSGSNLNLSWAGSQAMTTINLFIASSYFNASYAGDVALTKLIVQGVGTDPF